MSSVDGEVCEIRASVRSAVLLMLLLLSDVGILYMLDGLIRSMNGRYAGIDEMNESRHQMRNKMNTRFYIHAVEPFKILIQTTPRFSKSFIFIIIGISGILDNFRSNKISQLRDSL